MIIDLTYKCSMGCNHCISDCNESGEHMSIQTLYDVLEFCEKNKIKALGFSGGEIFENPDILKMLDIIADFCLKNTLPFLLTTNGRILSSDNEMLQKLADIKAKLKKNQFQVQVTDDSRYYPTKLDSKQRYRLEKLGCIVEGVSHSDIHNIDCCLYPQGRALKNFKEEHFDTKAPKCANCRLIVKQFPNITFKGLNEKMLSITKVCTPSIDPHGNIKLGESRLCPVVSNIYKNDKDIISDIANFKCEQCKIPIQRLRETNQIAYMLLNS